MTFIFIGKYIMQHPTKHVFSDMLKTFAYIWRHLRQRNSVDKIETYVTRQYCVAEVYLLRQHASRSSTI